MAQRSVVITIKDIKWKFKKLQDKVFDRKHKEGNYRAVTMEGSHSVDFKNSELSISVILHELCHVYYASCLTGDADHAPDQVEETLAKVWEMHYYEIGEVANFIYAKLKGE